MDDADVAAALFEDMLQALDRVGAARAIARRLRLALAADTIAVFAADPTGALEPAAWLGSPRPAAIALGGSGLLAEAARTRTPRVSTSRAGVAREPPPIGGLADLGIESLLALPVFGEGALLGLVAAGWGRADALDGLPATRVEAVARAASLGLRLLARLRAAAQAVALGDAAAAIETGLPLHGLLQRLVDQARELTGACYAALGVLQDDSPGLREFIWSGLTEEQAARIGSRPSGGGLLGAVVRDGPIRVADMRSDSRSCGVPPGHPTMTSFLGVPLRVGGEAFGNFYLADKEDGTPFTADDQQTIERLGAQAALAIAYAGRSRLLEEERERLQVLLEQVPVGILLFAAPHGNIVFLNEAVRRIFARPIQTTRPDEERPGLRVLQHADGTPIALQELPSWRALQGEVVEGAEFETVRPDGTRVPLAINAAPFYHRGRLAGTVVAVQDISQRKELERLREECAAIVAHDLRHPAVVIRMWLDAVLMRSAGASDVNIPKSEMEHVMRSVDELSRMIDDLRDASRIVARRFDLEPGPVAAGAALQRLVASLAPVLSHHTVEIVADPAAPPALVDPRRFDQIFTNLLSNAAKYSAPGSSVRLAVRAADGGVEIEVADAGVGIAAEELPLLFDRFYRASSARGKQGLGLGLYIARGLVEAHGGRISAESAPGRGSTFRVWLPQAPA